MFKVQKRADVLRALCWTVWQRAWELLSSSDSAGKMQMVHLYSRCIKLSPHRAQLTAVSIVAQTLEIDQNFPLERLLRFPFAVDLASDCTVIQNCPNIKGKAIMGQREIIQLNHFKALLMPLINSHLQLKFLCEIP